MALAAETSVTGAIVTASGIANSIDDIGTNTQGDSFMQQNFGSVGQVINGTKLSITTTTIINDFITIATPNSITQKVISTYDIVNNLINFSSNVIK